MPELWIHA